MIVPIKRADSLIVNFSFVGMYIATVYPCILSIANGGLVIFVNFQGPGDKPLGKTTDFKRFELQRNLRKHVITISLY